jgi:uncharacterized protein YkwD
MFARCGGERFHTPTRPSAIAHGLVRQWMRSPEHRENLLDRSFSGEGIGIAINDSADGQRVYATQALCG